MNTDNQAKALKFNLKKILVILMIAVVLIIGIIVSFSIACRPYDKTNNQYIAVEIKEDYSTEDIAAKLHKKHIIGNEDKFLTLTKLFLHGKKYQPGIYYLSPAMDFRDIARTLVDGISTNKGFVLPAGFTVDQTADALDQAGVCSKEDFMAAAELVDFSSFDFIDSSIVDSNKLEGFLLPTEYNVGEGINATMLIMNMLNEFDNIFNDEYRARAEELGLSIREVVTIASIIEKETVVDSDKADISSVIHNKLNLGMDFEDGYPDGPICSPSLASIKAALYPEDNENIYYVHSAKLDGSHIFTADKDEYLALKEAYEAALKAKEEKTQATEETSE